MLVEAQDALVTLLQGQTGTGQLLEGIKSVHFSDQDLLLFDLPGITVDWGSPNRVVSNGNHTMFVPSFWVTLYVASVEGEKEADRQLSNLLQRWDDTQERFVGLLPALLAVPSISISYISGQENCYGLKIEPEIERGIAQSQKHKHFMVAARITLELTTMVRRSAFPAIT